MESKPEKIVFAATAVYDLIKIYKASALATK